MEDRSVTPPTRFPQQGDVYVSDPSPLTGARELVAVVSSDVYNGGGTGIVVVAEIETGTRYRASPFATETPFGVVLADRVQWQPLDMLGEPLGQLTTDQTARVVTQLVKLVQG